MSEMNQHSQQTANTIRAARRHGVSGAAAAHGLAVDEDRDRLTRMIPMTPDQEAAACLKDWESAREAHRITGRLENEAWDRLQNAWKRRDAAREHAQERLSA
jgi:hypothetical protein